MSEFFVKFKGPTESESRLSSSEATMWRGNEFAHARMEEAPCHLTSYRRDTDTELTETAFYSTVCQWCVEDPRRAPGTIPIQVP